MLRPVDLRYEIQGALRLQARPLRWATVPILHRPMADHFALVPRRLADPFFLAISAYYSCEGPSWPPSTAWWQPACLGMGFEESVLFRYLHDAQIPYRFYSQFGYALARGGRGGRCDLGASNYMSACNLLSMAGMFWPPSSG